MKIPILSSAEQHTSERDIWDGASVSFFIVSSKSHDYKLVYKERFRSHFHLWPKAKLWKEVART